MKIVNKLRSTSGNSLAEFAVVIALMATLMSTGQVKFSQAGEGGKGKKSGEEIDKIAKAANNFYNAMNNEEGAGRFPGQDKWDLNVPLNGGYKTNSDLNGDGLSETTADRVAEALRDLTGLDTDGNPLTSNGNETGKWDSYEDALTIGGTAGSFVTAAGKWCSVFGREYALKGSQNDITIDLATETDAEFGTQHYLVLAPDDNRDVPTDGSFTERYVGQYIGMFEFAEYIDPVSSPFLDGHFIYTVIGGDNDTSPTFIVCDLMNPSAEFAIVAP